jgi:DNA-binding response OmpR family regulator
VAADVETGRLLVADDDADLLALIEFALRNAGFAVTTAADGTRALDAFGRGTFELVVLDVNMPGADGFTVCSTLRARAATPVIMLSARTDEADIVRAFELGADDYVTKPFSPRTLIARIRALLRRAAAIEDSVIDTGGARLDVERRSLLLAACEFPLTPLETRVLHVLMRNAGRVVSTERLATEAWGRAGHEERHALKQVVYRLRRKLERRTALTDVLETTRSAGYRWVGAGVRSAPARLGP